MLDTSYPLGFALSDKALLCTNTCIKKELLSFARKLFINVACSFISSVLSDIDKNILSTLSRLTPIISANNFIPFLFRTFTLLAVLFTYSNPLYF